MSVQSDTYSCYRDGVARVLYGPPSRGFDKCLLAVPLSPSTTLYRYARPPCSIVRRLVPGFVMGVPNARLDFGRSPPC